MAYTKQNFTSGQILHATHLNNIESGIVENETAISTLNDNLSNKADTTHTHDEYLTSIPSDYKTQTENDALYQPIGDYATKNDLPTNTSDLTNDSGFITEVPTIPTKTSELTNDSGFITASEIPSSEIEELTSPVTIWNLAYGFYKIPENCVIYYNGTSTAVSTTALSNGYLFVYGDVTNNVKHFVIFRGSRINNESSYSSGTRYLTSGWTDESQGNYRDIDLSSDFATMDDLPTKITGSVKVDDLEQGIYISDSNTTRLYCGDTGDNNGYVRKGSLVVVTWVSTSQRSVCVIGYTGGFYRMTCYINTGSITYDSPICDTDREYYTASTEELGFVKVGDNLSITDDGTLSAVVPTKVSELENDANHMTEEDLANYLDFYKYMKYDDLDKMVLISPNGYAYTLTVSDDGTLSTQQYLV